MLSILGIFFFFVVFLFLLHRMTRNKTVSLSAVEITLAFGCKVLMGCLYGYIFLHYFGGDDTWVFHAESLAEYEELFNNPSLFFHDFLPGPFFSQADSFVQGIGLYAQNLEKQLSFKSLAIFNIFSRGDYYINVVFFSFFGFWGHYFLFALLAKEFPQKRKVLLFVIFFFPPVVFWLSGIRGDSWIFFFTTLLLLYFNRWLQQRKLSALFVSLLALTGIFIFRNMLALLFLPALVAWWLAVRGYLKPAIAFLVTYGIACTVFFGSVLLSPEKNLPAIVVKRQQQFFALQGNTRFRLDSLQTNMGSFVKVTPQAFQNTFLRPFPWEAKGIFQVVSSLDILFFWALFLLFLWRREKRLQDYIRNPLILCFLFFGISSFFFIGFSIPFPGAIVRYKIVAELLLLIIFLLNIKWPERTHSIN